MVSKQYGVKMNKKDTAIFYSCGICNLNCNYCCIDKNPILKEIDKELGESFQGDYYFNQVKNISHYQVLFVKLKLGEVNHF